MFIIGRCFHWEEVIKSPFLQIFVGSSLHQQRRSGGCLPVVGEASLRGLVKRLFLLMGRSFNRGLRAPLKEFGVDVRQAQSRSFYELHKCMAVSINQRSCSWPAL